MAIMNRIKPADFDQNNLAEAHQSVRPSSNMKRTIKRSINQGGHRKGELRASSPFPLGGFSALPRTGGIPRPLEARPYGQTMPAPVRARHLDLATRRQQARTVRITPLSGLKLLPANLFEIPNEISCSDDGTTCSSFTHKHATMRPAAACDWCPRQRRLIWVGAAYRLATAAPLPPLTYVASSLGYELDCLVQELDNQGYQSQESVQPVHRQITSLHRRRRCRLAGLTPLTYLNYSRSDGISQTYVRFSNNCHPSRKAA